MSRFRAAYIPRAIEGVLKQAGREFPALLLTGPRQSGKTTLLRRTFRNHGYVSLEAPDVRAAAIADPRGFLAMNPPPVIFDEVQYAPELLPYIKEAIDERRGRRGQYLLTGSQNLLLAVNVSESLAGRAAVLRLLSLTQREIAKQPRRLLPWEAQKRLVRRATNGPAQLWTELLRGGYPELAAERSRSVPLWHASYVHTYLERDVRGLRQIGDLTQFQSFLRILAARSGQLLNLADIGRDIGVALNTAKAWLSVLEATYQVFVLRPYFANTGKRLVKTPKVFFTDTGTLCYLAGLTDPEHAAHGPMSGAIFETAVIAEVVKTFLSRGEDPRVYFWRTSTGTEVDLVIETGGKLIPIEIKATATPRSGMADGIRAFRKDLFRKAAQGFVIHGGNARMPLGDEIQALPFSDL